MARMWSFVVGKDDQVKLTPVTAGAKVGDLVRIDLPPGTRVVTAPPEQTARDGAHVAAAKK